MKDFRDFGNLFCLSGNRKVVHFIQVFPVNKNTPRICKQMQKNEKAAPGSLSGFRLFLSAGQDIGTVPQPRPSV